MWYHSCDCTYLQNSEDFYAMFKEEVKRHVEYNILPELKSVEETKLFKELAFSWTTYKKTISVFSELFQHLTLWIDDIPEDETPKDGIKAIGLKAFKNEVVLDEKFFKKIASSLKKRRDVHRNGSEVDYNAIKMDCDAIKTCKDLLQEIKCYKKVIAEQRSSE